MLTFVRKQQKSALIKLAFIVIILSFIVGYAMLTSPGGKSGEADSASLAARVNGQEIPYKDFQQTYSNLYRLYQNVYREQFTPALEKQLGLRRQAYDQLIDQTLLLQEADRLDLEVPHQDLVDSIAKIPTFQENGAFSKQRYLQVLGYQRMTPDEFEALQEHQLLLEKIRDKLQEGVSVSEEEIAAEFKTRNEKVNLAFARLAPALFEDKVKISDDDLAAYFQEHQEDFRTPDRVAISYLLFQPKNFADQVTLDQADIEKFYQRHLGQFEIPEQVKVAHVLIRVPSEASDELRKQKRELAEKVLAEARAGKDFAELARKYSDDKASVPEGGDLGYFTRGTMVDAFEKTAFALQPGEISDVVETPFGFHVIKGEGYIEAGIKSLADVLDQVKTGLRQEKAHQAAFEAAMDAYNINRKSGDLAAAAASAGLEVKQTGLFARGEAISGLDAEEEVAEAAFALNEKELARPVSTPQGVVLMTLKERQESHIPEMQEVRQQVEQSFRKARGVELARQAAEDLLKEISAGEKFAAAAKAAGGTLEETGEFARSYGDFVPRIGNQKELAETAFSLTPEAPVAPKVFEVAGKFVVAKLTERKEADPNELTDAVKDELRKALLSKKQEKALTDKINALKSQAEIMIGPTLQNFLQEG